VCRLLAGRGIERIAVEAPGYGPHALIAEACGMEVVHVDVDDSGLVVSSLADSDCEVVVVTAAHQFPGGSVLSPERRTALLEWAEDRDALIVEDDYDSELRHEREAVGALQGLAPERVANIGSFSVRLAPAVRLGWILSPSWLTGGLTFEQGVAGAAPPALDQFALADFIARGELDRHLRRMRLLYRARREALCIALQRLLPDALVVGVAAGVFALVSVPSDVSPATFATAAAARGVGLEAIELPGDRGTLGLVLGYGNLPEPAIADAVACLSSANIP
jgi:GntR family transcriptional regulator/MocR family aminotransferase